MPQFGVIFLENKGRAAALSASSILTSFDNAYRSFTAYQGTSKPSLPDYCAYISGSYLWSGATFGGPAGVDSGAVGKAGTHANLYDQIAGAGFVWKAYEEGTLQTSGWNSGGATQAASRHSPAQFFSSTATQIGSSHGQGRYDFSELAFDVANSSLPDFFTISPSNNNDGHDNFPGPMNTWLTSGGSWGGVQNIINAMRPGGLLHIVFDNVPTIPTSGSNPNGSGVIYSVVCGPSVTHTSDTSYYTHMSMTKGIQGLFGVSPWTSGVDSHYTSGPTINLGSGGGDTTPPSTATLTLGTPTSTTIPLTMTATDNVAVSGFDVYQVLHGGSFAGTPTYPSVASNFVVTGLASATQYDFKAKAVDSSGNKSAAFSTLQTATTTAGVDTTPPSTATLALSSPTASTVIATMTATDNVAVAGFDVYRTLHGAAFPGTPTYTNVSSPFTASGLSAATQYDFKAKAVDTSGNRSAAFSTLQTATTSGGSTTVSVSGTITGTIPALAINGSVTHPSDTAKGLLLNMRMVNALFDDLNSATVGNWGYPSASGGGAYSASRQNSEFIAQIPTYRAKGVDAVTISLTGGNPQAGSAGSTAQAWDMCAFNTDGTIPTTGQRAGFWTRLDATLSALDAAGMVCILQLFYFGEVNRLANDAARNTAMDAAVDWMLAKPYRGVMWNLANEVYHGGTAGNTLWAGTMFATDTATNTALDRVRARLVGGGWTSPLVGLTYGSGATDFPSNSQAAHLDWVGLQDNSWTAGNNRVSARATSIRALSNYVATPFPILVVEDQSIESLGAPGVGAHTEAVTAHVSTGYYEKGTTNADYLTGFQTVPSAWGLLDGFGGVTGSAEASKKLWTDWIATVSTVAGADTIPPSTATLSLGTITTTTMVATMTATDNVAVAGFDLYQALHGGAFTQIASNVASPRTITGLTAGTQYDFRALAVDSSGNRSTAFSTVQTATTTATGDTTKPTAPTGLTATLNGTSEIDLAWTAATDNVAVTQNQVWRDAGAGAILIATLGAVTSYVDAGLAANTHYAYYVQAVDAALNVGPQSNTASLTTPPGGGTDAVTDTFTRNVTNGWGTSDSGHVWSQDQGTTTQVQVASGVGATISIIATQAPIMAIHSVNQGDYDETFTYKFSALPTAGKQNITLGMRYQDAQNYTRVRVDQAVGGHAMVGIDRQIVNQNTNLNTNSSPIGTDIDTGAAQAVNTLYKLRFQCIGTTVKAKVWLASAAEPAAWTATGVDNVQATIQGGICVRSQGTVAYTGGGHYTITNFAGAPTTSPPPPPPPTSAPRVRGGGYANTAIIDPNNAARVLIGGDVFSSWASSDMLDSIHGTSLGVFGPGLLDRQIASFVADPATPGKFMKLTKGNVWESSDSGETWTSLGGIGIVGGGSHPRTTGRAGCYLADGTRVALYDQTGNGIQLRAPAAGAWTSTTGWPGSAPQSLVCNPADPKQLFVCDSTHTWRVADITAGSPAYTSMTGLAGAYEFVYDVVNDQMIAAQGQTIKALASPWTAAAGSSWRTLYTGNSNMGGVDVKTFGGKTWIIAGGNPYNSGSDAINRGQSSTGFLSDVGSWDVPQTNRVLTIAGSGEVWQLPTQDPSQDVAGSSQSYDTALFTVSPSTGKLVGIVTGHAGAWRCGDFTAASPQWQPAVNGLGGGIDRDIRWDIRDNGAATIGLSDHGSMWSPTGLYDQQKFLRTSRDGESIAQDPLSFDLFVAYDDGTILRYADPKAGAPGAGTDQGIVTGSDKNTLGVIRNGSGSLVQLIATKGIGVSRKVGAGAWATVSALGVPGQKHNHIAAKHSAGLWAIHIKGVAVYVSTDFGATWTSVLASTSTDDHAGSLAWDPRAGHDVLYYVSTTLIRSISGTWTSPTVVDLTNGLPVNMGVLDVGPNGHVVHVSRATSSFPVPVTYRTTVADLDGGSPTWTPDADAAGFYKNVGQFPLAISVNGAGNALVAYDGMGAVTPATTGAPPPPPPPPGGVNDDSGNGMTGTLIAGSSGLLPVGAPGPASIGGRSLVFDGTGGRMEIPDPNGALNSIHWTLGMWFFVPTSPGNSDPAGWRYEGMEKAGVRWINCVYSTTHPPAPQPAATPYVVRIGGFFGTPGVFDNLDSVHPLVPGVWAHIAGTYDGVNLKIYINAVLDSSKARTGDTAPTTEPLVIGAKHRYLNGELLEAFMPSGGMIAQPFVADHALTQGELVAVKNTTFPVWTDEGVSYTPVTADIGNLLRPRQVATNRAGSAGDVGVPSQPIAASAPPTAPVNVTLPTLDDTTYQEGDTASAIQGTWTGTPTPSVSDTVQTSPSPAGPWAQAAAPNQPYLIPTDGSAVGQYLRVHEVASNLAGTVTKNSAVVGPIAAGGGGGSTPVDLTPPTLTPATVTHGVAMTVTPGQWTGDTGTPVYTFWGRPDSNTAATVLQTGASLTYVPLSTDVQVQVEEDRSNVNGMTAAFSAWYSPPPPLVITPLFPIPNQALTQERIVSLWGIQGQMPPGESFHVRVDGGAWQTAIQSGTVLTCAIDLGADGTHVIDGDVF